MAVRRNYADTASREPREPVCRRAASCEHHASGGDAHSRERLPISAPARASELDVGSAAELVAGAVRRAAPDRTPFGQDTVWTKEGPVSGNSSPYRVRVRGELCETRGACALMQGSTHMQAKKRKWLLHGACSVMRRRWPTASATLCRRWVGPAARRQQSARAAPRLYLARHPAAERAASRMRRVARADDVALDRERWSQLPVSLAVTELEGAVRRGTLRSALRAAARQKSRATSEARS